MQAILAAWNQRPSGLGGAHQQKYEYRVGLLKKIEAKAERSILVYAENLNVPNIPSSRDQQT
jgi:hypothetical protein